MAAPLSRPYGAAMFRRAHDARVSELTRQRLAALSHELGLPGPPAPDAEPAAPTEQQGSPPAGHRHPGELAGRGGRHAAPRTSRRHRVAGWLADRVPLAFRAQHGLSAVHVGVVSLVLATGVALTVGWVARAGDPGAPVPARPAVAAPSVVPVDEGDATAQPAESGPETEPAAQIVVDVLGKVRRPGIAVLPAGSRVVDAVRESGGLRPGVNRKAVNLARVLVDGEQLLVGVVPPAGLPAAGGVAGPDATLEPLVNINTADQAELETLPGVGPVTATAILEWRAEHGSFTAVEELLEVSGIGEATLADLAPRVTL